MMVRLTSKYQIELHSNFQIFDPVDVTSALITYIKILGTENLSEDETQICFRLVKFLICNFSKNILEL